jgi:hypothetical protein
MEPFTILSGWNQQLRSSTSKLRKEKLTLRASAGRHPSSSKRLYRLPADEMGWTLPRMYRKLDLYEAHYLRAASDSRPEPPYFYDLHVIAEMLVRKHSRSL